MKTKQQKCPYFNNKECGNPDKEHSYRCKSDDYGSCISYQFLTENEEDEKDGKQNS